MRPTVLVALAALGASLPSAASAQVRAPALQPVGAAERASLARRLARPPGAVVQAAYAFTDRAGRNVVVLSRRARPEDDTADLYVTHLRGTGAATRVVYELAATPSACEDDGAAYFTDPAVQLSDADGDGLAELRVGLATNCTTDCSGPSITVVMIENGVEQVRVTGDAAAPDQERPWAFGQASFQTRGVQGAERGRKVRLAMQAWAALSATHAICFE